MRATGEAAFRVPSLALVVLPVEYNLTGESYVPPACLRIVIFAAD